MAFFGFAVWENQIGPAKKGAKKPLFYRPIPFPPPSSFRKGGRGEESPNQNPSGGNSLARAQQFPFPLFENAGQPEMGSCCFRPPPPPLLLPPPLLPPPPPLRSLEGEKGEGGSEALENGIRPSSVCSNIFPHIISRKPQNFQIIKLFICFFRVCSLEGKGGPKKLNRLSSV